MKIKKVFQLLMIVLTVVLTLVILTGCGITQDTKIIIPANSENPPGPGGNELYIGEGSDSFILETTDDSGITTKWIVQTDADTVGAALLKNGLILGDESDYGLMVTVVNGLEADYDKDRAYWAFYIDGEYAMEGVDTTVIEQGRVYALVYTKG